MNWQNIIKTLKADGYEGASNDLDAVKAYVADGNIELEDSKGNGVDFDASYAAAYPPARKLNTAKAESEAEFNARVRAEAERINKESDEITGKARRAGAGTASEISVGKDRFEDDRKGGFPTFGHFLAEIIKSPTTNMNGSAIVHPREGTRLAKWNKSFNQRMRAETEEGYQSGVISEAVYKATLSTYSNETTGADGGVAVPPEYRDGVMNRVENEDSLAARCDRNPISGNSISLNIDVTTPWQSSGGIQCNWVGEATTLTQSKLALQQRDYRLRKVCALVPMTEELAQDAAFLGSYITKKAGDKIGFAVDNAILHGDGVTQPTGVVGHNGTVSVAKETSQTALSIKGNNIMKMWMAAEPSARNRAVWVINPDCQVWLQKLSLVGLKDSTATAQAWGQFLFLPSGGLTQRPFDTLMGRPIIYHQAAKTSGTVGDITLFCGDEYLLLNKASGLQSDSSIHLWFDQAVNALRFMYRIEGQPKWPTTISALNGSQTYGAFVTLATRS